MNKSTYVAVIPQWNVRDAQVQVGEDDWKDYSGCFYIGTYEGTQDEAMKQAVKDVGIDGLNIELRIV